MTSEQKRKLTYGPWFALPLVLFSNLIFWNRLPAQMGVHLGWNGKTDGWMSREASLIVSLVGLAVVLLVSTWQVKRRAHVSRRLLFRHCVGACVITGGVMFVLLRNL